MVLLFTNDGLELGGGAALRGDLLFLHLAAGEVGILSVYLACVLRCDGGERREGDELAVSATRGRLCGGLQGEVHRTAWTDAASTWSWLSKAQQAAHVIHAEHTPGQPNKSRWPPPPGGVAGSDSNGIPAANHVARSSRQTCVGGSYVCPVGGARYATACGMHHAHLLPPPLDCMLCTHLSKLLSNLPTYPT